MKKALSLILIASTVLSVCLAYTPTAIAFKSGAGATHQFIFQQAKTILRNDGYENIADFLESKTPSDESFLDVMIRGSDENDEWLWQAGEHYMQPTTHLGLLFGVRFKSAGVLAQEKFDEAVDHWFHGEREDAMYDLGWAIHMVQDLSVPHHAYLTPWMGHSTYEELVDGSKTSYLVSSGGVYSFPSFPNYYTTTHYSTTETAFDWVDYNAHRSLEFFGLANYDGDHASTTPYINKWLYNTDYNIETVHPLPNDVTTTWVIRDHGASTIKIHFSEINVKTNDYIRVLDSDDNVVESFTNVVWYDYAVYVAGNTAKIEITTDSTDQSYGYSVDYISVYDTGHDPTEAAEELLKLAQRTTAGFIHFFFDNEDVWRTISPSEVEIVSAKVDGKILICPWDYACEPEEEVSINVRAKSINDVRLHIRVVMKVWEMLADVSALPVYDSSVAGEDQELWLDPGELSSEIEFQWTIPTQPTAFAYYIYLGLEDWDNSAIIYDRRGGWGHTDTNTGPILHVPYDNSVAAIELVGTNTVYTHSEGLEFLFRAGLKAAIGQIVKKVAGQVAGFGAGLFLSFLLSQQLAGWPPSIDAYAIDTLDGSLEQEMEIYEGESVPIMISLDTGDMQREVEVVLEKSSGLFREEVASFSIPIEYDGSYWYGCYEIFPKTVFTFSEPGDYYIVTSYSSAKSEIHIKVKPFEFVPIDLVLVLDRSGSMTSWMGSKTKIQGAKDSAIAVIDALMPEDRVAVVSFSSYGTVNVHMTNDFDYAKTEIGKISAYGMTSFGAGMSLALNELETQGSADHAWAIIFMSNGWHNTAPSPDPYVAECKQQNIPIYTVGLGSSPGNVNEPKLKWMASETGGKYLFAPSLYELQNIFLRFSLDVTGWTPIDEFSGIVYEGQTITAGTFDVAPLTAFTRITLNWPGSDLDLEIERPDGSVVDLIWGPDNTYSGAEVKPEWVILLAPQEGTWTVRVYGKTINSPDEPFIVWVSSYSPPVPHDTTPPTSSLTIGSPKHIDALGDVYISSSTPLTLDAMDDTGTGSGVAQTGYRISNATYDSGWIPAAPPIIFQIVGLEDGSYQIDYNSTDNAGNVESTNTQQIILDNTPPVVTGTNFEGLALQDGVTLQVSAWDLSEVASITLSIQCIQGDTVSSMSATLFPDGKWKADFDTTLHPDGFYFAIINGTDVLGNTGNTTIPFSIRNWAVVELLPASTSNKGGRTMPIKFSLRVAAAVDPAQPFVYNEELNIAVYKSSQPANILQNSTYGTTARDYRINSIDELYITNFRTKKQPTLYVVEIYRKGMLLDTFTFETVK